MDNVVGADTAGTVHAHKVGTVAAVGGAGFIVGALGSAVTEWAWLLMLVGMAAMGYVVPKLHAMQDARDGWPGKAAALLVPIGAGVVVALGVLAIILELATSMNMDDEPAFIGVLWMIGFFAFAVGVVLFCIGAIKAKRVNPVAPALLLAGIVAAIGIDMATGAFFEDTMATTPWGLYIGVPVVGLALAWIGYELRGGARTSQRAGVATG